MNRPAVIAVSIAAALLLAVVMMRLAGSFDAEKDTSVARARPSRGDRTATDPMGSRGDAREGRLRSDGRASLADPAAQDTIDQRTRNDARVPEGAAARGRDRVAESVRDSSMHRRADGGGRGNDGAGAVPGLGSGRAGGIVGGDANFRDAAERLADGQRSAPVVDDGADGDGEEADAVVHAPPATPVVDSSMTYNSGDYRFSLDSPFQIPHTGDAGTVALWVQPEWSPDNQDDAPIMELGDGNFQVYKNVNVLRFEVNSDSPEHSTSYSVAGWQAGEWHAISASWADGQVTFYVDGQPVGKPIPGTFKQDGETPVTIGAIPSPDQQVAPATVSDVSLRNRALSPSEIAKLYNRSALAPRPK